MNLSTELFAFWLADVALLSTALLAIVRLAFALIKQPSQRLAIFRAALVGLVALAVLPLVSEWRALHLLQSQPEPTVVADAQDAPVSVPQMPQRPRQPRNDFQPRITPVEVAPPFEPVTRWSPSWQDSLAIAFAGGSLLMFAWMALGAWQARRLVRKAEPASDSLRAIFAEQLSNGNSSAQLLLSEHVASPVALGAWRPTVLIPSSWTRSETPSKLRSVLAHEAAHLRHGDLRLLAGCRLISLLYWAQPLFWILKRRVRLDQETLVDAAAAEATSRHDYAQQLVGWARQANTLRTPRLAGSVGLWEGPSQLRRRVAVLLDEKFAIARQCTRTWLAGCTCLTAVAVLGLSLITLQPARLANAQGPIAEMKNGKTEVDPQRGPIKKLSNGARVQLLAIGTHGEAVPTWWKPDGTPLEKPGFTAAPANNISPLPKRQLVFTVEGMSDDANITWETAPGSNTSQASALFPDNPDERVKYFSHVFDAATPFTLRVGVASGEWNTLVSGLSGAGRVFNKRYVFSDAMIDQRGKTLVIVSHDFDGDVRVVAIDKESKQHVGSSAGGTAAPPLNQTKWVFDDLLPGDIETCRLQARGYEWVEFADLPFQMKRQTREQLQKVKEQESE